MGYVVKTGDVVKSSKHQYKILKELNKGGFADAYKAVDETGRTVFFKQYKSPSKLVPWFNEYFRYEDQLHGRLRSDSVLKTASVYAEEIFLSKAYKPDGYTPWTRNESIYQVFPFIEGNTNLEDMISRKSGSFDWEKRLYACTVFAFALRKLHDANVIHCDLKPENVQVKYDPSIAIKYRPLLIDMDWSIMSDSKAPWHGYQGYVGTVGYNSPEHLRNEAPQEASDVFTAAIILSQVMAKAHPFGSHLESEDLTEYVLSGSNDFTGKKIPWGGDVSPAFEELIRKALDVNPGNRPTMTDIHAELVSMCKEFGKPKKAPGKTIFDKIGGLFAATPKPTVPRPARPVPVVKAPVKTIKKTPVTTDPDVDADGPRTITISGDIGEFVTKQDFTIDQRTLRQVTSYSKFADPDNQFRIKATPDGWAIVPNVSAANYTVLNEMKLETISETQLRDGDVIELMGKSSGKKAMPLKVRIV